MQKKLAGKLAIIVALCLTLLIPLWMIEGQIRDRGSLQHGVLKEISETSAGSQTLVGPVLIVRYRERVTKTVRDKDSGDDRVVSEIVTREQVLPAHRLDVSADARVETRSRGIYRANLYHVTAEITGSAEIPPNLGQENPPALVEPPRAYLVMGLSDLRGVGNDPEVTVNGRRHRFSTDGKYAVAGKTLQVALGKINIAASSRYDFAFPLQLSGTGYFELAPTAHESVFELKSAWPHPSFQGRFLPQQRDVTANGFSAHWRVSHLARNFEQSLRGGDTMKVDFIEPVNIYLKAERAVKYALIFIVLTFAAFFLREVIRRTPIHPLQYLMVGLALAIFFLLLIALSEHMPFGWAYLASALACIGLIGAYMAGVLADRRQGAVFAGGLALLYAILYGVLLSEDSALLMGALLLFVSLAAVMLLTRRIDWYQLVPETERRY